MHPDNKCSNDYNFSELAEEFPDLKPYLILNKHDSYTLDFSDGKCVRLLNQILLKKYYQIEYWQFLEANLCPTVPGRADYLHYVKDIIGEGKKSVLDIGTGASIIYPLLGNRLFNWSFVSTDIDKASIINAQKIIEENNFSKAEIELRLQINPKSVFENIVETEENYDACICNPPFFESQEHALRWNQKKWKNEKPETIGTQSELICEGGEKAFITNIIQESVQYQKQIKLFTCLVSKKSSIPFIEKACAKNKISSLQFIEMKTGRKVSRIAIWKF